MTPLTAQKLRDRGLSSQTGKSPPSPGIVHSIMSATASSSNQKTRHISDLVVLGFYFCLRSCKYTKCTGHRRTVQFHPLLEFVFFVGYTLLPPDAQIEQFQNSTQTVLALDNQKNTIRGETVFHFRWGSPAACQV